MRDSVALQVEALIGSLDDTLSDEIILSEVRAMIAQQQEEIQALTAALKAQAAQLQKVSEQIMAQVPAPRLVAND